MVGREAAWPLAHGQMVPDDPREVSGRDPGSPLSLHAAGPYSRATCTVAATSCTRTIATPETMAAAAVASDPSIRSPTGVGVDAPCCRQHPEKPLATGADHHPGAAGGIGGADQLGQVGEKRQVVRRRLAESDPGIDPDLAQPRTPRLCRPLQQEGTHLCHDVGVARVVLHGARLALHVHRDPTRPAGASDLPEGGRDVVDQRRPGGECGLRHLGLDGVDRDPNTSRLRRGRQRLDHGHHARQLDVAPGRARHRAETTRRPRRRHRRPRPSSRDRGRRRPRRCRNTRRRRTSRT